MSQGEVRGEVGMFRLIQELGRRAVAMRCETIRAWPALLLMLAVLVQAVPANALNAHGFRMAGDESRMRIVFDLDSEPNFKWFLLRAPHRLVIDLPDTRFGFEPETLSARGMVTGVRYGNLGTESSRIILSASGPFEVERLSVLGNERTPGFRMMVDLVATSEEAFASALADQATTTGSTIAASKSDRLGDAAPHAARPFRVVIDPGHGGIDGGAEGLHGTVEKDITLSFARELRDAIEAAGRHDVFMTRDDDSFLRLDERVRIARQHEADLFISVHADTINLKGIRGATVYTISEKASDSLAAAAAKRENLADAVAGIELADENQHVADILFDLTRRETHGFSVSFARSLVGELTGAVELINNPLRSAGFRVLRAPDVPSVLVELGYLSNPDDEKQLTDKEWRLRAARSIAAAVDLFAAARQGAGG